MYGLPVGETFRFFVGLTLSSFSLSRHQINLIFANSLVVSESTTISIEGRLGVQLGGQEERTFDELPRAAYLLAELLDRAVIDVTTDKLGTLALSLDAESILRVYDSSEHYESYQIHHRERTFVV